MATLPAVELHDRLRALCGPEHVTDENERTVKGLRPRYAVAPGTLEEVAAVLSAAREADAAVIPWGGGTQQNIGATPTRADLILHTRRLTGIVEWEPADLTAGILAGTTLAEVQRTLAAQGQQIAIDAPNADLATVGGLVATNTTGSRRWRYGGWRDQIVGMEMALADGSVIKSGGRVVKNVQGYDLAKLFIGSLGTLGLIGRVNVKLLPLPPMRRLVVASHRSVDVLAALLSEVAVSQLRTSTLDLVDAASAGYCRLPKIASGLILFEGSRAAIEAQTSALARLAQPFSVGLDTLEGTPLDDVWKEWSGGDLYFLYDPGRALLTASVLPGEVAEAFATVRAACERTSVPHSLWAHAGNGIVYAALHVDVDSLDPAAAISAIQAAMLERWPATTIRARDMTIKRATRPWGADPPGLAAMRAVKRAYDPAGILNPGRYVGGI